MDKSLPVGFIFVSLAGFMEKAFTGFTIVVSLPDAHWARHRAGPSTSSKFSGSVG